MEKTIDKSSFPDAPAIAKMWENFCKESEEQVTEEEQRNFIQLVDRRLIIASFEDWAITVIDPVFGRVEPAIGDYLKYYRSYLFFYSDGSPKARRRRYSAFRFVSRLLHLLKRVFTRSLKPGQPWALASTDQDTRPEPIATRRQ